MVAAYAAAISGGDGVVLIASAAVWFGNAMPNAANGERQTQAIEIDQRRGYSLIIIYGITN